MAVSLKILGMSSLPDQTRVQVQLTITGSYATFVPGPPASGGDTISFTALIGVGAGSSVFAQNAPPVYGVIQGSTGDDYDFVPGSTLANGILVVNTASNSQLSASGYPARITGDLYLFGEFVFNANL